MGEVVVAEAVVALEEELEVATAEAAAEVEQDSEARCPRRLQ